MLKVVAHDDSENTQAQQGNIDFIRVSATSVDSARKHKF